MAYQPYDRNPSGVLFFGTNSTDQVFESNNSFVYDSGNNRLGINNAVPSGSLHVDNLQIDTNTLSATNTNGNLIISPNGTGALQADAGGNARGAYAVDLQRVRGAVTQVASGNCSTVSGGGSNIASGAASTVSGGFSNCASGTASTVSGGYCNNALGNYSIASGGRFNTASGNCSTASGGLSNTASASYSTVGGGSCNSASENYSTVAGGRCNTASGYCSTVGGGCGNTASGYYSATVSGGRGNTASAYFSTVGGGALNLASGLYSTVDGGSCNTASGTNSAISGGCCNITNGRHSTINGGHRNILNGPNECCSRGSTIGGGVGHNTTGGTLNGTTGDLTGAITCCNAGAYSTIGGGLRNSVTGGCSVVAGGNCNQAPGSYSTATGGYGNAACGAFSAVGGGQTNCAAGYISTVSGGYDNTASAYYSTVSGGYNNTATGESSTVGGGGFNVATARYSTVSGGVNNCSSGTCSTIGGGQSNRAVGTRSVVSGGYANCACGCASTVGGGASNTASGLYSSALGYCNVASHTNAHIIGSGITSSAADTLYTNKICANNTITGTSIIKAGGTSSQFLKADGSVDSTNYTTCVGTVTGVSAGNGMDFATVTSSGPVTLGTPSDVTLSSTSSVTANSHTHAFTPGGNVTEYIRGDGTLAIFPTNVASGVGSSGHVAIWTSDSAISYDNNQFFWDQTNNRLGIGTVSPSYALDVVGSGRFTGDLNVDGDLTVNGTTTTVNSIVVTIEDPIIVLGSGTPTVDDNKDRGVAFNYFDGSAKQGFFGYDDSENKFTFMTDASIAGEIVSGTVGTIKANLNGNADTATDADGLSSAVTVQLSNQLSGSGTFQDSGDTCNISASLTADAITDQTEIGTIDGDNDHLLIYDSGVGLRKVTPQNLIDDLNIVTSFNISDGITSVQVDQGETINFTDGTGAEFVVSDVGGQPTITVSSVDGQIVHDNLSGVSPNEHINHTGVILTAGAGLSGGGDITASRTFDIDISEYATAAVGAGDSFLMLDSNGSTEQRSTVNQLGAYMAGDNITNTNGVLSVAATDIGDVIFSSGNFVDSARINFTVTPGDSVTADLIANTISETYLTASVAGDGLTGGNGTALAVGAGNLIDVQANQVDVDLTEAASATIAAGDYLIFLDGGATGTAAKGSTTGLAAVLAGNGLVANSSALDVNVDDSTIEVVADVLQVKDGGITEDKITRTVDDSFANNDTITADINLVAGGPGGISVKLPAPSSGKIVYVKKIDSAVGAVTVLPNSAESIDGASQKILYSQYESLSFVADSTNWFII
jgi:hypothetical protein